MRSIRAHRILLLLFVSVKVLCQDGIVKEEPLNGPVQRFDSENVFYRIDWYNKNVLDSIEFFSYTCEKRKIYHVGELTELPKHIEYNTFKEFIEENLKIPVYYDGYASILVSAIIESSGSLSNIRVEIGADDCVDCNKEAIKVVKSIGKAVPGKLNNKFVPCYFIFIIKVTP